MTHSDNTGLITHSRIEKLNETIYISLLDIPGFIKSGMSGLVPPDYRTAPGIDLYKCEQAVEYCSEIEITRVAKAGSLKRQIEWLCGRIALKELLRSVKFRELQYRDIIISYDQSGKPYIQGDENTGISLSHSGDFAIAALHCTPGKKLGIDLERAEGTGSDSILTVAFSTEERAEYRDKPHEEIIGYFTMKEAYLKLIGKGFHEVITRVTIKDNRINFDGIPVEGVKSEIRDYPAGYKFSVIYEV